MSNAFYIRCNEDLDTRCEEFYDQDLKTCGIVREALVKEK